MTNSDQGSVPIVLVVEDEPLPGYQRRYVDDPFGNRIELIEPD